MKSKKKTKKTILKEFEIGIPVTGIWKTKVVARTYLEAMRKLNIAMVAQNQVDFFQSPERAKRKPILYKIRTLKK